MERLVKRVFSRELLLGEVEPQGFDLTKFSRSVLREHLVTSLLEELDLRFEDLAGLRGGRLVSYELQQVRDAQELLQNERELRVGKQVVHLGFVEFVQHFADDLGELTQFRTRVPGDFRLHQRRDEQTEVFELTVGDALSDVSVCHVDEDLLARDFSFPLVLGDFIEFSKIVLLEGSKDGFENHVRTALQSFGASKERRRV
mmetsp:Transcript_11194/g.12634  ORF Transcript_11194/g.12634 Transcript_11194/m.12634 type:complete len:201 (+) Transcript_11194:71-673(+)